MVGMVRKKGGKKGLSVGVDEAPPVDARPHPGG